MSNPLIKRYRFSAFRPASLWISSIVYVVVVSLTLFINISLYQIHAAYDSPEALCSGLFYQFFILFIFLFWFRTAYASGSAISEEISGKTYDFFRMLPLSALQKTTGIILGKNLLTLLFCAITFAGMTLFAFAGNISVFLQAQIFALLFAGALFLNNISLLSSLKIKRKQAPQQKTNAGALAILIIFVLPALFTGLSQIHLIAELENFKLTFYGLGIPVLFYIAAITTYFAAWASAGILRRFTHENSPLFSKTGALFFLGGFQLVLYGILWKGITAGSPMITATFWALTFLVTIIIPFGSTSHFDSYVEQSRNLIASSQTRRKVFALIIRGNLMIYFLLFLLWSIFALQTAFLTDIAVSSLFVFAFEAFTFYAFIMLLLETYAMYTSKNRRAEILIALVAILYIALPLLIASIFDVDSLFPNSLIGYFMNFFQVIEDGQSIVLNHNVWITNLLLCIPPAFIIRKRYHTILVIRRSMEG
jgi:hypothetical protein